MKYSIVDNKTLPVENSRGLHSLALKVLSNLHLTEEQFDNLFFSGTVFPEADSLDQISARLLSAREKQEKVFVFGDYDADGICSTTMMVRLLKSLKIECGYYIPDRLKEGYGLSSEKVMMAIEKGYRLIVTVDNGVSAFEALSAAREKGVEVIVTDHHNIPQGYSYDYLLHPDVFTDSYFCNMCGAGVVLQLKRHMKMADDIDWILAMTATIGDMMPLFFANREIVKKGLLLLNKKGYRQIQYLSRKEQFDETVIAYDIVPAINTLGRLADRANVNNLVRYFLSSDEVSIVRFADQILSLNKERQQMVKLSRSAKADIYRCPNYDIYVSGEYHEGIIGLLANAFMHESGKPTLVFSRSDALIKGSGRSPEGTGIYDDLKQYEALFSAFGGHDAACGMSLKEEQFELLLKELKQQKSRVIVSESKPVIEVSADELTLENVEELFSLRPFGEGIQLPDFYMKSLKGDTTSLIKGIYRKTVSRNKGESLESICFNQELYSHYDEAGIAWHDIIFSPSVNTFRGKSSVSLTIKDVYN